MSFSSRCCSCQKLFTTPHRVCVVPVWFGSRLKTNLVSRSHSCYLLTYLHVSHRCMTQGSKIITSSRESASAYVGFATQTAAAVSQHSPTTLNSLSPADLYRGTRLSLERQKSMLLLLLLLHSRHFGSFIAALEYIALSTHRLSATLLVFQIIYENKICI